MIAEGNHLVIPNCLLLSCLLIYDDVCRADFTIIPIFSNENKTWEYHEQEVKKRRYHVDWCDQNASIHTFGTTQKWGKGRKT